MANEVQAVKDQAMVDTDPEAMVTPGFTSLAGFTLMQRMAKVFCYSAIVPETFRGEQNFGNCVIAIEMATRMHVSPLMLMQNMYIVYGNPAFSSKFLISTFNACGRYTSIKYKETGKKGTSSQGCVAYTTEKATGEIITGPEITIGMADAEGWSKKSGSKWKTMPEQMLRYRAAAFLIRTTAPELSMGYQTDDEIIDITPEQKPINAARREIEKQANAEVFNPVPAEPEAPKAIEKQPAAAKTAPIKQEAPKEAEKVPAKKAAQEGPAF